MSEIKNIPTITTSLAIGNEIEICSEYSFQEVTCGDEIFDTDLPLVKIAKYYDEDGNLNGVIFKEGELMIAAVNMPADVDLWIDNQGNLIIKGNDATAYYIDDNGDLIYDYCVLNCLDEYYDCDYIEDDYINP